MNYVLTEHRITLPDASINRHKFEEWLRDWHPLDFPRGDEEEMNRYWGALSERNPENDIMEYAKEFCRPTEFDRIKRSLERICG